MATAEGIRAADAEMRVAAAAAVVIVIRDAATMITAVGMIVTATVTVIAIVTVIATVIVVMTAIAVTTVIVATAEIPARMIVIPPAVQERLSFKNAKSVLNGHSRPDVMTKPDHIANVPSPLKLLNAIKSELGSLLIRSVSKSGTCFIVLQAAIFPPPLHSD